MDLADLEVKKYDPRQPRDDHGKWSDDSGGISVGHAIHVMKSEGITDEAKHDEVRKAIESGQHTTREQVLAHIDSIHHDADKPQAGASTPAEKERAQRERLLDAKTPDAQFAALHPDVQRAFNGLQHSSEAAKEVARRQLIHKVSDGVHPKPTKPKGMPDVEYSSAIMQGTTALMQARASFQRGKQAGESLGRKSIINEYDMTDTLISYGSEIKALGETADGFKFGGYLVVFGTHDASNLKDKFTADTDFDIENGDRRSVYYNHGLDGTIKRTKLGHATLQVKDAGVWIEGEIKKRNDYLKAHADKIVEGIKNGVFGLSSGAPAHLVEREKSGVGHEVKMWPIAEASITPTPAEPQTSCFSLKSLLSVEGIEAKDAMTTGNGYAPEVKPAARDKFLSDDMEDVCPECGEEMKDGKCEKCGNEAKADEEPAKKSTDEYTAESLEALETQLPDGLSFVDHSTKVLAANEEFIERAQSLADMRCVKSNRRWSHDKYELLNAVATKYLQCGEAIKALADAHAPKAVTDEAEASLEAEIDELEISFMQQQLRLQAILPQAH